MRISAKFFDVMLHAKRRGFMVIRVTVSVDNFPCRQLFVIMQPPSLLTEQLPRVDRSATLPRWCALPIPGTHLLVTDTSSIGPILMPIDRRRSYIIGGAPENDVVVKELNGIRLILMHHRNGNVYLSKYNITGSSLVSDVTGYIEGGSLITLSIAPFELRTDTPITVNGVQFMVTRRIGRKVLRDCLREFTATDEQTRNNTLTNISGNEPTQIHKRGDTASQECTPMSVKYKKKRRKRDLSDNVARSVQFIDM